MRGVEERAPPVAAKKRATEAANEERVARTIGSAKTWT